MWMWFEWVGTRPGTRKNIVISLNILGFLIQVHFANPGDETNAFSVHFKTVPQDSTGVAHILEHVTLCGSEKWENDAHKQYLNLKSVCKNYMIVPAIALPTLAAVWPYWAFIIWLHFQKLGDLKKLMVTVGQWNANRICSNWVVSQNFFERS